MAHSGRVVDDDLEAAGSTDTAHPNADRQGDPHVNQIIYNIYAENVQVGDGNKYNFLSLDTSLGFDETNRTSITSDHNERPAITISSSDTDRPAITRSNSDADRPAITRSSSDASKRPTGFYTAADSREVHHGCNNEFNITVPGQRHSLVDATHSGNMETDQQTDFENMPTELSDSKEDARFLEEIYSKRSFVRDEVRIVLIGKTGSGKSATGNTLTGQSSFESKLSGTSITAECKSVMFERFGRNSQVVDTIGLFDTRATQHEISKEVKRCVLMTSPGIHALILVIKVGRFTEEDRMTVDFFKKVFGDGLSKYLMIVFTGRDALDAEGMTIEDYLREAPQSLQALVAESKSRYLAVNNRAHKVEKEVFVQNLFKEIDKMVAENSGRCYTTTMFRKAEEIMKKREEEARKRLEDENKKEREAIENRIKEKYDPVMKEQESKMASLQQYLDTKNRRSTEELQKQRAVIDRLTRQLEMAENDKRQIEKERMESEEKQKSEMEKIEEHRNTKIIMVLAKMEEDRKKQESELNEQIKEMEKERRMNEENMRQKEEERQKKGDEFRQKMIQLEKKKQEILDILSHEQRKTQETLEQLLEGKSRTMARAGSAKGSCSIL